LPALCPTCPSTRCVTPTPTPTATPTVKAPICDASGPYTQGLSCSDTAVSTTITATKSRDPQQLPLDVRWTSNCPGAAFINIIASTTQLTLNTKTTNAQAVSCKVGLTVTNSKGLSASCEAQVLGGVCNIDCAGALNGNAKLDRCGVCSGDGNSCLNCTSVDIKESQLAIDIAVAQQRKVVASLNRVYETLAKNTRSAKTLAKVRATIKKSTAQANSFYQLGWTTVYTALPPVVLSCTATFCVNVSNVSAKNTVSGASTNLRVLAESVQKNISRLKVIKSSRTNAKIKALVSRSASFEKQTIAELTKVPASSSSCN